MSDDTTTGLIIKKDVETVLTEARRHELGAEIAAHTIAYDELEEAKKDATKELTARMKAERADWTRKAKALRTGKLAESVECVEESDFRRYEVSFRRIDNGEIVGVRPMTVSERQPSLDGIDEPADPIVSVDKTKAKKRLKAVPDAADVPSEEQH